MIGTVFVEFRTTFDMQHFMLRTLKTIGQNDVGYDYQY